MLVSTCIFPYTYCRTKKTKMNLTLPDIRQSRKLLIISIVLILVLSSLYVFKAVKASAAERSMEQQLMAAELIHKKHDSFNSAIDTIAEKYPGVEFSVGVSSDRYGTFAHNGSLEFDAGSTTKVLTAAFFMHEVENGRADIKQPIDGKSPTFWMRKLLVDSDDEAWQVLNSRLTHPRLKAYASSIGLRNYDPAANSLTIRDSLTLMTKLSDGQLLNDKHTSQLEGFMGRANYRDYIVAAVPDTDTVYHKVGITDGNLHDMAIIERGGHKLILNVFTFSSEGDTASQASVIRELTHQALTTYL